MGGSSSTSTVQVNTNNDAEEMRKQAEEYREQAEKLKKQAEEKDKEAKTKEKIIEEMKQKAEQMKQKAEEKENELTKKIKEMEAVEKKTKELQVEVKNFKQEFPVEEVKRTVATKEDVLVLTYKDLKDTTQIFKDIDYMFTGFPGSDFIAETAQKFITAITSTDELKEILRWQSNKVIKIIKGKAIGIEIHYKLIVMEETTRKYLISSQKETVLMVAYKSIAHVMNASEDELADWDDIKAIKL